DPLSELSRPCTGQAFLCCFRLDGLTQTARQHSSVGGPVAPMAVSNLRCERNCVPGTAPAVAAIRAIPADAVACLFEKRAHVHERTAVESTPRSSAVSVGGLASGSGANHS